MFYISPKAARNTLGVLLLLGGVYNLMGYAVPGKSPLYLYPLWAWSAGMILLGADLLVAWKRFFMFRVFDENLWFPWIHWKYLPGSKVHISEQINEIHPESLLAGVEAVVRPHWINIGLWIRGETRPFECVTVEYSGEVYHVEKQYIHRL